MDKHPKVLPACVEVDFGSMEDAISFSLAIQQVVQEYKSFCGVHLYASNLEDKPSFNS